VVVLDLLDDGLPNALCCGLSEFSLGTGSCEPKTIAEALSNCAAVRVAWSVGAIYELEELKVGDVW
jgi:hypothetical protein